MTMFSSFTGFVQPEFRNRNFAMTLGIWILLSIGILLIVQSLTMQNIHATYAYDGDAPQATTIPFAAEKKSDYMNVDIAFSLSPLHASRFIIGPDDCIEEFTVNGIDVPSLHGACNMHPGIAISLPHLTSTNTIHMRILDTGGTGGVSMRISWLDPMFLFWLIALVLVASYTCTLCMRAVGVKGIALLLPLLLSVALAIRIGAAWHGGFGGDLAMYKDWAQSAATYGVAESYTKTMEPDMMKPNYPPLSMILLGGVGHAYKAFLSPSYDAQLPLYHIFIKLPAIFADLLSIVVVYILLVPLASRQWAFVAAALYAINPAVIHDSSIWGQTDSLFTLGILLTLLSLQKQRWFFAGICFAGAMLLKMQALIVFPVLFIAILPFLRRWLFVALGGALITAPVLLPFLSGEAMEHVLGVYTHSVGFYSNLSSNAYNIWVMFFSRETGKASTDLVLNLLSYRDIGLLLWCGTGAVALNSWFGAIHADIRSKGSNGMLLLSTALIAYGFFVFNAEMHERYLFPYMALGLALLFTGRTGIALYLWSVVLFTLNIISIVSFGEFDRIVVQEYLNNGLPVAVATGQVVVFTLTALHIKKYHSTLSSQQSFTSIVWPYIRKHLRPLN